MASTHHANAVSQDTPITIKVSVNDNLKKLKLPLKDLGASTLPDKLRLALGIKPEQTVVFERFSDSAGGYVVLDVDNPQVFKTLIRAAKAKLKLRLKATVSPLPEQSVTETAEAPEEKQKHKPMEPVIVRSPPVYQATAPRDSDARSNVGSGIFQFREARASQQTLVDVSEAPLPRPFITERSDESSIPRPCITDNKDFFDTLAEQGARVEKPVTRQGLVFRSRPQAASTTNSMTHPWSVYCNECDVAMADAHFHCNICDGGDYDLCQDCVDNGTLCGGEGHWLIKRFIKDGKVVSSTTERISPRKAKEEPEVEKDIPGAYTEETKTLAEQPTPTRTCNSCVVVLPEREFVTCLACDDFDLCISCHASNKHGHHPAHGFKPATEDTVLPLAAELQLAPGRNVRHSAICDGCDKKVLGVRYKCLNCPDWDFCSDCFKNAKHIHPRHRFAPLYEPIPEPRTTTIRHYGIFCDGPLCNDKPNQHYIDGVRYKCAVCHDTDFCANCEALPGNSHNRTHPLIKFKTPVRNVSITTENEDVHGQMRFMGDRRPASMHSETKTASTETTPVAQANAATQVQTVAEIKPTEEKATTQPIPIVKPEEVKPLLQPMPTENATLLNAHFVQDSVSDGTVVQPGARFTQMWTMRNPGPYVWPSGCSVRFVGGDNMLDVDNTRPAAVSDIANASESNVVGRAVQVNEEVAFKVTLKAPVREGKHISYWRTKAADGTPFGHRLWCDIEVKAAPAAVVPPPQQATLQQTSQQASAQALQAMQMQMLRQKQQAVMQQQAMAQQQQQAHRQQMLQHQAQAQAQAQAHAHAQSLRLQAQANVSGPPPSYDASYNAANISARIAAMREQQAKRREHMMQQFNTQSRDTQGAVPSYPQQVIRPEQDEDEKARKEAARQRVEHIKAKIMRAREDKMKAELQQAKEVKKADSERRFAEFQKNVEEEQKKAKKVADDHQKAQKIIEEVAKAEEEKSSEDLEGSQMVFPKLDKESPSSSTYESAVSSSKGKAAYVENEQGEIERSASPSVVASPTPAAAMPVPVSEDDFDQFEVLSANDEESEDDGFDTDEEYDILDASDNETVASK